MQGRRRNKDERIKFNPFPKRSYQVEGVIQSKNAYHASVVNSVRVSPLGLDAFLSEVLND